MRSDVQIAQQAVAKPIVEVASELGIDSQHLIPYGYDKAKVSLDVLESKPNKPDGKLILVTAITPTPAGEGKTTTTIGLADALRRLGKSVCVAIREPSLGPCFGIKGGAAGGGYAQVIPMTDINLHFTGDFHAITTAHNLLSALLDNHLQQGNELRIDPQSITWKRVMDMNERALRNIVIGLGGKTNGVPRESGFDITTASEIMALLALSTDLADLRKRLQNIVVAFDVEGKPVTSEDLHAAGAMLVVLKDALLPNLVQTLEGTPAFVHAGPFGNIAHGCNSVVATKAALRLSDYVVTEAGFGSDLGAEKFFNIKCRTAGIAPAAAVVVATIRALKMHGGVAKTELDKSDPAAVGRGIENLHKHCENIQEVGLEPIVAMNKFETDSPEELQVLAEACKSMGVVYALSDVFAKGGEGGLELAEMVYNSTKSPSYFHPAYDLHDSICDKVTAVARKFYGAAGVEFAPAALKQIKDIERLGYTGLPVCIAKTQNSLSDDAKLIGRPKGFTVHVREVKLSAGAGFVVVYAGNIMTMPGLPKVPAANGIGLDENNEVYGLF